mmetsp:Transcript_115636/g.181930  ORF Transcript_115636/g.181930 Transcript_115636/m.181930 type:complete len:216 (-) Transcript_115636:51-698(-)|eukprot:CAMPEP_0169119312 /NCGR_PEP_ID=MMETSP1015-20121227/31486_1 /TAXON_ID=342587 /ORGANISM="Karlodinium micrum, Strain CCMP2283" /LENGTH=215 /DNA_ID=CAMNT_0009182177 /DNA_START=76 /DNA_END=723 /DNA_ORIENTATION=+
MMRYPLQPKSVSDDEDVWECSTEAGSEPELAPVRKARAMAVFDFDNTLSVRMSYNDLGGSDAHAANLLLHNAKQKLARDPNFWYVEFGGEKRVKELKHMLHYLDRGGVHLCICSFNDDNVIVEALSNLGLLKFFTRSDGSFNILSNRLGDKDTRVSKAIQQESANPHLTMFIDDSERNCKNVTMMNRGVIPYHCGETGLSTRDMQRILNFFEVLV